MNELPSWLLSRAAARAHRLVTDRLAEVDAKGYHYRALVSLADHGPASQAELGRRTGIHLSDMVATLNELTAGGHVERAPDPADRRRNVVTLTPAGRRRVRELDDQVCRAQDQLTAVLDDEERAELIRLLGMLQGPVG